MCDFSNNYRIKKLSDFPSEPALENTVYQTESLINSSVAPIYENYLKVDCDSFHFDQWKDDFTLHNPYLIEIPRGQILPRKGGQNKQHSILDANGEVIPDIDMVNDGIAFLSRSGLITVLQDGFVDTSKIQVFDFSNSTIFLMSSLQEHKNYYHWHIFYAQFLSFVDQIKKRKNGLLLTPRLDDKMRETITLSGLTLSKVIEYDGIISFKSRSIVTSSYSFMVPRLTPYSLKVFDKIANNIDKHSPFEFIYISRNDSNQRRINNECELILNLESLGFKSLELSRISYHDQISIFKNAKVVVAPHGAGLTNLLFSAQCESVLEIFSSNWVHSCYRDLCYIKKIPYSCIFFPPEDKSSTSREANINVDIDVIIYTVKKIIKKARQQF